MMREKTGKMFAAHGAVAAAFSHSFTNSFVESSRAEGE